MHKEYIDYLKREVKTFDRELISILELPSVESLRARIKKERRDTKEMLALYKDMERCNVHIKLVKAQMRNCNQRAEKMLGHRISRVVRSYNSLKYV